MSEQSISVSSFKTISYFNKDTEYVNDKNTSKIQYLPKEVNNLSVSEKLSKKARTEEFSSDFQIASFHWKFISKENLNLKYARVFSKSTSDNIFHRLENEIEYFNGDLLRVRVCGKWHDIPRKQVSYGESGLSYTFSGVCIPAVPWEKCAIVSELKKCVETITNESFNFVLVNRYKNGEDHIGEHRDDEKDLVSNAAIASLSFGQNRDFVFKHKNSRGKNASKTIPPLKLELEHGSLLLMEWPTNKYWYHSLPVRKNAKNVRINLTFRKMVIKCSKSN